jgi:predicted nucleic acid-binding protein
VQSFVDTNILLYAEDRDAKSKHAVARDLILKLWDDRKGVISVQVLQEFYVNATRKLKKPLTNPKALEIVEEYLTWTVVENTSRLLTSAIRLHTKAQLSFWDAMVVQAAIEAGCELLYSEDLNDGQRFGSLVIVNPFK